MAAIGAIIPVIPKVGVSRLTGNVRNVVVSGTAAFPQNAGKLPFAHDLNQRRLSVAMLRRHDGWKVVGGGHWQRAYGAAFIAVTLLPIAYPLSKGAPSNSSA